MGPKKAKKVKRGSATTMTYVAEEDDVKVVPMDPDVKEDEDEPGTGRKAKDTPKQCHLCQKVLRNKYVLKAHMRVHGDKSVQCDECDMMFGTQQALKRHKQCKHMDIRLRPFPCSSCDQRFLNKSHLAAHVKTHTGERDVTCGLCFQAFYSKADLVRHMKGRHLNIRSFTCHICNKGFFRKSYLKLHLLTIHMQPEDQAHHSIQRCYQCRYCKKIFNSRTTCYSHERSHNGTEEQRSLCMICGKTFSRPSSLKKHLEKHNGPPSLKCQYCDRPFYHLSSYKRHLNIHNRPDPDVCQVCGTLFTNRDAFRRHLRKHVARGDLAQLPAPEREEPKITKMQQLISNGVNLDEILKTCKVEVVELGGKNQRVKPRDVAVDALIAKAEKQKWILEVDELNNSIRSSKRRDFDIKIETPWEDDEDVDDPAPLPTMSVESLGYANNKIYTVISDHFKSIVKNNAIPISNNELDTSSDYLDFSKFTKPCFIYTLKSSCGIETTDTVTSLTATDILLHKDVDVELFSTVTEIEIPNYIEEIPELRPDLPSKDLFQIYDIIEDGIDVDNINLNEDVFRIEKLLQKNLSDTCRPLEIIPRSLSKSSDSIPSISKLSMFEFEKALDAYDGHIHSTLPHFGVETITYPRDWREFRDPKHGVKDLTEDELHQEIAQVMSGKTRVFWIKNLHNVTEESKDMDDIPLINRPLKYEPIEEVGSPGMDEFIYEDMVDPMDHHSDSEPDVKPDVKDLHVESNEESKPRESVDENKENRKKKRTKKRIKSESEEEYTPKKRRRNTSETGDEVNTKKLKKKKSTTKENRPKRREKKKKKKKVPVIIEIKEDVEEKKIPREVRTPVFTEYICSYCDKKCANKGTLKTHIFSIHMVDKTFSCHVCGLSFVAKSRLEAHIEYVHLKIRNYQCDKCEWAFYARADLERHERRHTGVKPFMCHLCSKTFVRKAQLKSHIVIHSGERKFMCNMCGKAFATRSTLVTHLKRHSKQPTVRFYKTAGVHEPKREPGAPILCAQCGKELSTPHSLKRHIEFVHEKVNNKPRVQKAFQCPACPCSFGYKTSMQRHMHKAHKRYKEPRTHSCPVCGRRLLNEACVLRHMVKRHPYNCDNIDEMTAAITKALQRNIPCPICKRKFLKESGLQKHMAKKHYYKTQEYDNNLIEYTGTPPNVNHDIYHLQPEEKPNIYHLQPEEKANVYHLQPDEKPNLLLL